MQSHVQDDPQAAAWRKPRRSFSNGNCLEAGAGSGSVLVRDTEEAGFAGRTVLAFSAGAWREFTDSLRGR